MMQESVLERITADKRPITEWIDDALGIVPRLYEHDPELSRRAERVLHGIASSAANLDCIRTDDRSAPMTDAPAEAILRYLFARWPETRKELSRVVAGRGR
ncbi:MAG TPA: hypothetical protein VMU84_12670 [Thermoanaerobaculia bacterium]|nr:hypothetical protein [Thermoanaerobaculia bacterium]